MPYLVTSSKNFDTNEIEQADNHRKRSSEVEFKTSHINKKECKISQPKRYYLHKILLLYFPLYSYIFFLKNPRINCRIQRAIIIPA